MAIIAARARTKRVTFDIVGCFCEVSSSSSVACCKPRRCYILILGTKSLLGETYTHSRSANVLWYQDNERFSMRKAEMYGRPSLRYDILNEHEQIECVHFEKAWRKRP